jgi:pyruvate/2-oxoacid:ferredoxin oxidoreductase alpha subunit
VDVPDPDVVARFLPPYAPQIRLDPAQPRGFGGTTTPAQWRANRLAMQAAMTQARHEVVDADRAWRELTGRSWPAVETYRMEDADLALVTTGGIAGTARAAVDRLREDGIMAGITRIRQFRPFPATDITDAVAGVDRVAVIDRNCSVGSGGIVGAEVRAALMATGEVDPIVLSYVAGLGGVNVSVDRVVQIARDAAKRRHPSPVPILEEAL